MKANRNSRAGSSGLRQVYPAWEGADDRQKIPGFARVIIAQILRKRFVQKTSIYFSPYHSTPGAYLNGSTGRFRTVEQATSAGEWPYDNGDDPSFYPARRGSRLTWGVCRENIRNSIEPESIIVFFSYTKGNPVLYRMCAIATVNEKLDRRKVFADHSFNPKDYINLLIRPEDGGWRHDEDDRPPGTDAAHADWLWRLAIHGRNKKAFEKEYERAYSAGWFAEGEVPIALNYIIFSQAADETYISPNPPQVATAVVGQHEEWTNREMQELTVLKAAACHRIGRSYLRTENSSNRNVHPVIHFNLPSEEAAKWRGQVIAALKRHSGKSAGACR